MKLVPIVDQAHCLGYGDCVEAAPHVFAVADTATVVGEGPPELVLEAARACPADAIRVVDAGTGKEIET